MDKQASDQGWEQLQAHIETFLGQTLRADAQKVEYKPRFNSRAAEAPSVAYQNDREGMPA
ncbi:MAG: hypothetical protein M0009_14925 [Deltaproteobacteria bacterium]|nr:hypothetical protein [Deltaproteobacteria bacterium]